MAGLLENFPFELIECKKADALGLLAKLRRQGQTQGFTPVLIPNAESTGLHMEVLLDDRHLSGRIPAEILVAADTIDATRWFATRQEMDLEGREPDSWPQGEWPSEFVPNDWLSLQRRPWKGGPWQGETVYLSKIPTTNSWELPAYLRFGGWNACPQPEEHVAIARDWHARYGAEIATMSFDTIEFQVQRPPTDLDSSEQLAIEQYLYCGDIVDQGVGSIRNLAATLLEGKVWYFWWD